MRELPEDWEWTKKGPDMFRAEGPDAMHVYATKGGATGGSGRFHPDALLACCEAAGHSIWNGPLSHFSTEDLVNELRRRRVAQEPKQTPDPEDGCNHSESYTKGAHCSWCGEAPGPGGDSSDDEHIDPDEYELQKRERGGR